MTVNTITSRVAYAEDGVSTVFAVPFRFLHPDELDVERIDDEGVVTTLRLGTDYRVSGGGDADSGAVTRLAATDGQVLRIRRATHRVQPTRYPAGGRFPAASHELGLDRTMMVAQETADEMSATKARALLVPDGELAGSLPSPRDNPGRFLAIGPVGDFVAARGTGADLALREDLAHPGGGAIVGVRRAGTGAITRTLQDKLGEAISVKDYGAIGDGVHDDTLPIGLAMDAMRLTGGTLLFPPGTYRITSRIARTFAEGTHFRLSGYGARIDATAIAADPAVAGNGSILEIGGRRLGFVTPKADVVKNGPGLAVDSVAGIAKGGLLLITSSDLWNPARPQYLKGEVVLVSNVVEDYVVGATPINDAYRAVATKVYRLEAPRISVEGLELICDAKVTGLTVAYALNPIIRDVKVRGARYAAIYTSYTFGGLVQGNQISDVIDRSAAADTSYGVSIGSGQFMRATANTIHDARHAIACGGFEPARDVIVSENICYASPYETSVGAIDAHGNVDRILIRGNITTGLSIAAINVVATGNIIRARADDVPAILIFQELSSDFYVIEGNQIDHVGGGNAYGIWVGPTIGNVAIGLLSIRANRIRSAVTGILVQPRSSLIAGCSITELMVSDNDVTTTAGVPFLSAPIGATDYAVARLTSSTNSYKAQGGNAFLAIAGVSCVIRSIGDFFSAALGNGELAHFGGTDVSIVTPRFVGAAGNSRSVRYSNTGRVSVVNPHYANLTFKAELTGPTIYQESGWPTLAPTIQNTSGARIVAAFGPTGQAISYGDAAPAAGTGSPGDRHLARAPAVGQPKGWIRTDGGPWVSEGNL